MLQGRLNRHRGHQAPRRFALGSALCVGLAMTVAAWPTGAQASDMVSVRHKVLNMRAGPGTQHATLWQLGQGFPLQVVGRKGQWLQVRDFENDTGWVARSLTSGRAPHHIVKSGVANVRSGPGLQHRVLGQAQYGEVLRTLARQPSWVRVEKENGLRGWVSRPLLWGW